MNAKTGGKPERNFRVGGVRAAVWKWTNATRDGRTFGRHKVVVDRSYRDNRGEWQTTNSLEVNDIPKAILALCHAFDYMHRTSGEDPAGSVMEEEAK